MFSEDKILFENIRNFRHLLTEGVGESEIIKAIQNHEWIYINYSGDDGETSGSRTVRPYVLGTHKDSGNQVLRAWQDNPRNSYDFQHRPTRKDSYGHDYFSDAEGEKPGWRMFNLDKITHVYPMGRKFNNKDGSVMIPPRYHEGADADMSDIKYYVSTSTQPEYVGHHIGEPQTDEPMSRADRNKARWDSIRAGNKSKVKITADDVKKLKRLASNVQKTAHGKYLVVVDDNNNFQLMLATDKDKQNIPDAAIIDTLPHLVDSLVNTNVPTNSQFHNKSKERLKRDIENNAKKEIKEAELPTIPFEKKTFFK